MLWSIAFCEYYFAYLSFLILCLFHVFSNSPIAYPDSDNCYWKRMRRHYMLQTRDLLCKQVLNNSSSTLCGELKARLHFFQLRKKKVLLLSVLWNIVGGKLTSHHTFISYFLKLSRPDSLVYDFSFISQWKCTEEVQLE